MEHVSEEVGLIIEFQDLKEVEVLEVQNLFLHEVEGGGLLEQVGENQSQDGFLLLYNELHFPILLDVINESYGFSLLEELQHEILEVEVDFVIGLGGQKSLEDLGDLDLGEGFKGVIHDVLEHLASNTLYAVKPRLVFSLLNSHAHLYCLQKLVGVVHSDLLILLLHF